VTRLTNAFRNRLLPAVLTAAGVSLIAVGLLTYSGPVEAGPGPSPSPVPSIAEATPSPSVVRPTFAPPSGSASPSATPLPDQVATRVVVPALKIDMPVVLGPANRVLCNVAMYVGSEPFVQPGIPGSTYLYAHARTGMFLPLLTASQRNNGKAMKGMLVEVYTNDDQQHLYLITEVRRHVPKTIAYVDPYAATTETLWLQTSEGPKGTPTVLQVLAEPLTVGPATHEEANPVPKPVNCG
jgi:sortase (surface protein transpeptidase)